jgi:amino-acid N-acetyltransferase
VRAAASVPLRVVRPALPQRRHALRLVRRKQDVTVRAATSADADAIHALIVAHLAEGQLLPRTRDEIAAHAGRFIVAADGAQILACVDLAPLGRSVAEVRSLVVAKSARARGVGRRLVDDLVRRATTLGFEKVCAFTHSAGFFVRLGFSIVPHAWLPEKIGTDCRTCAQFRRCGQYAVMLPLVQARPTCVPLASLHG